MYRTLILRRDYRPCEIIDWKDAVGRMFSGKITVLAQYDEVLAKVDQRTLDSFPELKRSLGLAVGVEVETFEIKVPAVGVIERDLPRNKSGVKFSKVNVALRDEFRCAYCGKRLPLSRLSYDHVLPRSRGGKTEWGNIVMACHPCNLTKANRTPEEAKMPRVVPVKPRTLPMMSMHIDPATAPSEWVPFLAEAIA